MYITLARDKMRPNNILGRLVFIDPPDNRLFFSNHVRILKPDDKVELTGIKN